MHVLNRWTDEQPETNIPRQLLWSWGHNQIPHAQADLHLCFLYMAKAVLSWRGSFDVFCRMWHSIISNPDYCHFHLLDVIKAAAHKSFKVFVCLCWGLTSQSTIFQSCRDGTTASWVINQYFRGVKCLAQGHNTAAVGFEPPTSRSGVRHSTTEPPCSPF